MKCSRLRYRAPSDLRAATSPSTDKMSSVLTPTSIPEQVSFDGVAFRSRGPRGGCADSVKSFDALAALVQRERKSILEAAARHGAVLLRGFAGNSAEGFAAVADALNLEKYPYVGGAAPRTNVVRDVVFTTNESPPSEPIPFHHEIAQVPDPPSYIMFYCETPPPKAGRPHHPLGRRCAVLLRQVPCICGRGGGERSALHPHNATRRR